jgi:2-amino-4-hydroxy-6-hydroxymethyldihydropteridine diphosphokinase
MITTFIGLGSNLSDPEQQIRLAITSIKQINACEVTAISSLYFSRPMGPQDQPNYMNAVIAIKTTLSASALLDELQAIENNAGRIRKDNRWGARILDLDIILFGNEVINTQRLTVPHYGLKLREFVLFPLNEIAPLLTLPDGDKISILSKNIDPNGLKIHSKLI